MAEDNFRPEDKIKWAEEFKDSPFYRNVFMPWVNKKISECMTFLVVCDIDMITEVRGVIKILKEIEDFVQNCIDAFQVDADMERDKREFEKKTGLKAKENDADSDQEPDL